MQRLCIVIVPLIFVVAIATSPSVSAQTVQLPTFHSFSYSGSVLVPDRGTASLGGVSRSATRQSRGRGQGRAAGGQWSHSGASAQVTIIDHDAIDRQLRGLAPRGAAQRTRVAANTDASKTAAPSKRQHRASTVDPDAEGKMLVRYARKQFLAGKKSSAFNAYQLAISCLSPGLAELATEERRRVFPDGVPPRNARVADARNR